MSDEAWFPPTLQTDRLVLRALTEFDAPKIFAYASNPNVSQFTLWEPHRSVQDSVSFVRDYVLPSYKKHQPEPFGITLKSSPNLVIGTVGCFSVAGRGSEHTMELAYALSDLYWGQGLVVEASMSVLSWVFSEYSQIERIQARCKLENQASARVMQKLGMKHEGKLRNAIYHRGRHWDMLYYSVLRAEWLTDQRSL